MSRVCSPSKRAKGMFAARLLSIIGRWLAGLANSIRLSGSYL